MADILKNVVLNCDFSNRPVNTFALGNSPLPPQLNPRPEGPHKQCQGLRDLVKGEPTPNPPPTHFSYYIHRLAGLALCCATFLLFVEMVWELTFVGLAPPLLQRGPILLGHNFLHGTFGAILEALITPSYQFHRKDPL